MLKRTDGRANDELRKISFQKGFIKWAEGSCLIEMGNTKVICTASIDKNVPNFLKGSGQGWITAEYGMLPRATHTRNLRDRVYGRNTEIQRLIGRALRSVVNLSQLGERTVWIDCDVIQADGGTRVASVIGGFIALVESFSYLYNEGILKKIPIKAFLGAISVGIWKGNYILDLNFKEDSECSVDMNIIMNSKGEFVEIQGTAEKNSFSQEELSNLIRLAQKGINEIIDMERNIFKDSITNL